MSNDAYHGDMDPSDLLGVFFVFKQLQKPAMKISGVLRSLIKKSANLERLNGVIFAESDAAATGPEEEKGEEEGGREVADNAQEVDTSSA